MTAKRPIVRCLALSVVLAAACGGAVAKEETTPLRIAVGPVLPPLVEQKADGTLSGFLVELLQEAGAEIGRPVEFVLIESPGDWSRLDPADVPLAVPLDPSAELSGYTVPHTTFLEIPLRTFARDTPGSAATRTDMRVAVRAGSESHRFVQTRRYSNVTAVSTVDEAFELLYRGKVDRVIANEYLGVAALRRRGERKVWAETERTFFAGRHYSIAHAANAAPVAYAMYDAVNAVRDSGRYDPLHKKWLGSLHRGALPIAAFLILAGGFSLGAIVLLLVTLRSHYRARDAVRRHREEAVDARDRLTAILEGADVIAWESTLDAHMLYVNDYAVRHLGYSRETWTGSPRFWSDTLLHPDDRDNIVRACETAARCGEDHALEYRVVSASGEIRWLHDVARIVRDRDGTPFGMRGMMIDITERKQAESETLRHKARLQAVWDTAPVGMFRVDVHGRVTYANPKTFEILGLRPEEAENGGWWDAIHSDDREAGRRAWERAVATQSGIDGEVRYARPADGRIVWVICRMDPQRDPDGQVVGFIGTLTDITELKRGKEDLEKHVAFERAVSGLSAALVGATARSIDETIHEGLADVGRVLGVEILGVHFADTQDDRVVSIAWSDDEDTAAEYKRRGTSDHWPWVAGETADGRDVAVESRSELPPEAETDRRTAEALGIRSFAFVAAERSHHFAGGMAAATCTRPLDLSSEFRDRLRLIGQTVSNALQRVWARDAQRATQERFDRAVLGSLDGYWDWPDTRDASSIWWSPRFFEMLGYAPDAFPPSIDRFFELVHPDDRDRLETNMAALANRSLSDEKTTSEEFRMRTASGAYRWFVTRAMLFDHGDRLGLSGSIRDTTERKVSEEKLLLTQRTIDANAVATFWIDASGTMVYTNASAREALGYDAETVARIKVWDIDVDLVPEKWNEYFEHLRAYGSMKLESTHQHADGSIFPVEINASFIDYQGTRVACCFARDITLRRLHERQLVESEERFRQMAENALVGIAVVDETRFTYVNATAEKLLGRSREELLSLEGAAYIEALVPESDRDAQRARREAALRGALDVGGMRDIRILHPDGRVRWLSVHVAPIESGPRSVVVAIDITERKEAEEAVRESRQQLQNILDAMFPFVGLFDIDGRIVEVNRTALGVAALKRDEVIGTLLWDAYWFENFDEQRGALKRAFERAAKGETVQEDYEARIGEQQSIVIATTFGPVYGGDGQVIQVVGSAVDITNRKRTEEALRRREDLLQRTERIANVGGWELDLRTQELFWTDEVRRIHEVPPDFQPTLESALGFYTPESAPPLDASIQRAIDERIPWVIESEIVTARGRRIWVQSTGEPVVENGEVVRLQGAFQDISERKRAEQERLEFEAQVQQAQKLESLGVLAGGIAHDFNNLLVSILGYADLAFEEVEDNESLGEYIHQIEIAARRAADLAKQMLAYSGKGRFHITRVNLTDMTREIAELLAVSVTKNAHVRYELADDLPVIQADPPQIQQVVMNLITNASDALEGEPGVITLRTGTCDAASIDPGAYYLYDAQPDGRYVYLDVSDTGCGMAAETQERIFDPFYSTKFSGRGLGLAAVLGIVRGHQGAMSVRSVVGRGTRFVVYFPVAEDIAPAQSPPKRLGAPVTGSILVVDDEKSVRELARRALTRFGHTVHVAGDGEEALTLYAAHEEDIDAVLLDLTMPVMSGEETFEALRERRPDLPVLIMSGYSETEFADRFRQGSGPVLFLQKPFQLQTLRERIEELFAARAAVPE